MQTDRESGAEGAQKGKKKKNGYLNVSAAVLSLVALSYEYHHLNALFHRDVGCRLPPALSRQ